MFRKAWIILLLTMALCLCACGTAGLGESTGATTVPGTTPPPETTVPPETTAPSETTGPVEPLYPAAPVLQAENVLITDTVPEYDLNASGSIVLESDGENPWFKASYIHLFTNHAFEYRPLDDNVLWICEDPQEMMSDSHYKNYIVENGQLKSLQKKYFSRSYTLLGTTVQLELEYSLYEDQVLINHVPVRRDITYAEILDTGRGVHECLARFYLALPDGQSTTYYAKIDLETGQLTDLHQGIDPALLSGTEVLYWCDNNDLILTKWKDPLGSDTVLCRYNAADQTLTEYTLEHDQYDVQWGASQEVPGGLLYQINYCDKESGKVMESKLWMLSRADGSMVLLSDDAASNGYVTYGSSYILYQDSNKLYYVYHIATGEYTALPDMNSTYRRMQSSFIYQNDQGAYYAYDVKDNESVLLTYPEGFDMSKMYTIESYDGKMFAHYYCDENGTYQILVFDANTNTLIELQRTGLPGVTEKGVQWAEGSNKLIITLKASEGHSADEVRDLFIYDFSGA